VDKQHRHFALLQNIYCRAFLGAYADLLFTKVISSGGMNGKAQAFFICKLSSAFFLGLRRNIYQDFAIFYQDFDILSLVFTVRYRCKNMIRRRFL